MLITQEPYLCCPNNANIDDAEITKFEAVASRWWDRNGAFKALHDINGSRVGYIDARAAGRLGLYMLIPLASWVGSAFVERFVDAALD